MISLAAGDGLADGLGVGVSVPPPEGVDAGLDEGLDDGLVDADALAAGLLFAVSVVDVQATGAIRSTAANVRTRHHPLISVRSVRRVTPRRHK